MEKKPHDHNIKINHTLQEIGVRTHQTNVKNVLNPRQLYSLSQVPYKKKNLHLVKCNYELRLIVRAVLSYPVSCSPAPSGTGPLWAGTVRSVTAGLEAGRTKGGWGYG